MGVKLRLLEKVTPFWMMIVKFIAFTSPDEITMAIVSVAAEWQLLCNRYYRKPEIYQMGWKHVDLSCNKVAWASFGGPIAVIRDDSKIVQLYAESAVRKLSIFNSAGVLLSETVSKHPGVDVLLECLGLMIRHWSALSKTAPSIVTTSTRSLWGLMCWWEMLLQRMKISLIEIFGWGTSRYCILGVCFAYFWLF